VRLIERSLKKQAYYQQGKCDPSLKKSKKIPDLAPEKIFGCMFRCNNCGEKKCFLKIKLGKKFGFVLKKLNFFHFILGKNTY